MLFLTRRVGEEIVLPGYGVTLQILKVGKNQIRLGLTAPGSVRIQRSERTVGPTEVASSSGEPATMAEVPRP